MTPFIFLSLLGSAVVLGAGFAIGAFEVLKRIAKQRAERSIDQAQIVHSSKTIEQIVVLQKAVFVMGVLLLGVLLFARTFSN